MIQPLLIGLLLPAAVQEQIVAPSPPPDRFDLEHHELLVRAWGGRVAAGPPGPQRPAIRPARWSVVPTPSVSTGAPGDDHEGERESPEPRSVADGASDVAPFALAEATVRVDEDEVRFVRAPGARAVFVNGEGFVGDPERRGDLGVPVLLRAGENSLELVDFGGGDLDVELWDPVSTMVLGTWAHDYDGSRACPGELPVRRKTFAVR